MKKLFTTGEAAEMLDVSQSWIIKMMEDGKIPFIQFGGRRKIKLETIEEIKKNGVKL